MPNFEMPGGDEKKIIENKEKEIEHIPTQKEIRVLFEKLVGETNFENVRVLEDEKGLYLWEIKIMQEEGSIEYLYCRKGDYKARGLAGGSAAETAIHITFFDEDGIPISGHSVCKYIDGMWKDTP